MQNFEDTIQAYLDKQAETDSRLAERLHTEGKNVHLCCEFIIDEARKRRNRGDHCVVMTDEEVYGLAIHFYDEDFTGSVDGDEHNTAVTVSHDTDVVSKKSADKNADKMKAASTKKNQHPSVKKAEKHTDVQQLMLFDL